MSLEILKEEQGRAAGLALRNTISNLGDFENRIDFSANLLQFAGAVERRDPLTQVVVGQRAPLFSDRSATYIVKRDFNLNRRSLERKFPQFDLQGQTALVTGAARGLGRAISLALANAGANVALGLRDVSTGGDSGARNREAWAKSSAVTDGLSRTSSNCIGAIEDTVATSDVSIFWSTMREWRPEIRQKNVSRRRLRF